MPDDLLRIGPFSRASWLSIKALRAYHEAGLLVPAVVDPSNGYRSYTSAQLTDAVIIRRLRDLDVPLEAIGEVLRARDPEVTRKVLAEQMAARWAVLDGVLGQVVQHRGQALVLAEDAQADPYYLVAGRRYLDDAQQVDFRTGPAPRLIVEDERQKISKPGRLVFTAEGGLELTSTSLSLTHKSHRT